MRPIPVDSDGMVVDERLDGCACAYVTPSHQSPTTVTLPLERRMALLERAQRGDFLIVEDDYEAEANFMHAPTTALKAMDRSGRVIYVRSEERRVGKECVVRVDLGGRRIIKKKKKTIKETK